MGFDNPVLWFVGLLVVAIIVVTIVIPTALTTINTVDVTGSTSAELWTGTAATAHTMANVPLVAVTTFKKAATVTTVNTTALVGANGVVRLLIDPYAAHDGTAWNNVNITVNNSGANTTTNLTWVVGTCNTVNKTISSGASNVWNGIASTCLTPGSNLVLTFVNHTTTGEDAPNVTGVSISYLRYVDNTAYTLQAGAGTITPTATGYYYTSYTYGTVGSTTSKTVLLLVPLLIALALLLIVLKPIEF